MTLQQAEAYVREYQKVLLADAQRGRRHDPGLLPTCKENLLRAIKLQIAQLYYVNGHSEERLKPLLEATAFLDSFSDVPLDTASFIDAMQKRRAELNDFYLDLLKINRSDPFFWQRIYEMCGVSLETRRSTFVEGFKQRLGIGTAATREISPPRRTPVGRLVID